VWAVGNTAFLNGSTSFVEHWDGSAWHTVPLTRATGHAALLADVSVAAPDDVWAVGAPSSGREGVIEHWDGSHWRVASTLDLPTARGGLLAVSTLPGATWAVGSFYDGTGELTSPIVAERHTNGWHLFGSRAPVIHRASLRVTTSSRTAHIGDRVIFEAHATNVENRRTNLWINYVDPEGFVLHRERCVAGPSADTPSCEFSYVPAHDRVEVRVIGRVTGPGEDASVTFCAILVDRPTKACKRGSIQIVP
jgi:hypothetical protein